MRPKERTAPESASGGQAMAAQPCCPCLSQARGKAGERECSRSASALTSARVHSGNWRRRKRRKRSRNTRRPLRLPSSAPPRRARSRRNIWPSRRAKRSTVTARLTLVQQVATAYLQIRALDGQLEITNETIKVRQDSVDLTKKLESGGSVPLSDVRQAEQLLYAATSEVPQLEEQIQQQENAIALLLGEKARRLGKDG